MITPALPEWFTQLLQTDAIVRNLWQGRGKPAGTDQRGSGYDYNHRLVVR